MKSITNFGEAEKLELILQLERKNIPLNQYSVVIFNIGVKEKFLVQFNFITMKHLP